MSRAFLPSWIRVEGSSCQSALGLFAVLWLVAAPGVDAGPVSTEFQINQLTTGDQQDVDVAPIADGGFVVVWQGPASPGDDPGRAIIGRRFDAAGEPVAGDFQVNTSTPNGQVQPRISSRSDGSFVVVWKTLIGDGILQARPYDTAGMGADEDFVVEDWTSEYSDIAGHDVGALADGGFVVAFHLDGYDYGATYYDQVHRRQVDDDGMVVVSTAMTPIAGLTYTPRISSDDLGFVVNIHGRFYGENINNDIETWRFGPSGAQVGSPIRMTPFPLDFRGGTSADSARSPDGDFVVVWNGFDDPNKGLQSEIYSRYVDAGGVLDPGGPVLINEPAAGSRGDARVARGANGSFLVVWESFAAPGDAGVGLRGRWLSSTGSPTGDEFAVNSYTTGDQSRPEVTAAADGRSFLVVWQSESGVGDTDGLSVRGRHIVLAGVFTDGFESGTTSAWSNTSP